MVVKGRDSLLNNSDCVRLLGYQMDIFVCGRRPKTQELLQLFLLDFSFKKLTQPLSLSLCIIIIFFFLLFSITISIYHSIIYVYLPTYVNLPMSIYLYKHTYLPMSNYLSLPTYINIPTYLDQHTYPPMSTYQHISTHHYLPTYLYQSLNINIELPQTQKPVSVLFIQICCKN